MTLDANGKYVVVPEVHYVRPLIVRPPGDIPWADRLDNENPRFPWDDDVKQGKTLAIDCSLLIGGDRYDAGAGDGGDEGVS